MNKNGTDLNTKIEKLKQLALKSGNKFVVDMINSNKNPNDLFYENMSKMINKGNYSSGDLTNNIHRGDNDNDTLILDEDPKNNIFNNYKNADEFFLYERKNDFDPVKYYKKIIIDKTFFFNYLSRTMGSLYIDIRYYNNDRVYDSDYIVNLIKGDNILKVKIQNIITTFNNSNNNSRKLGDKFENIILKYKGFIKLINFILTNIEKIVIEHGTSFYENGDNGFTFSLQYYKNNDVRLSSFSTILSSYDKNWENVDHNKILLDALKNKNEYNSYQDYLSNVIIIGLLFPYKNVDRLKFLNFTEEKDINKFLNFVKNDKIIEFLNFTEKEDIIQFMVDNNMCDQIATFILTTCLFIGK